MGRSIALAAGALVSVGVFTWLAGPLLETLFGTEALVIAYAGLAVAAGTLTYALLRRVDAGLERGSTDPEPDPDSNVTIELKATDVEEELERIRDEA